jgi:hypothetical protein
MAKALFLIIHETPDGTRPLFIVEAHYLMAAVLKAALANHPGKYVEGGEIPPTAARRVPKGMMGRTLTQAEAKTLLARLEVAPAKRKKPAPARGRGGR